MKKVLLIFILIVVQVQAQIKDYAIEYIQSEYKLYKNKSSIPELKIFSIDSLTNKDYMSHLQKELNYELKYGLSNKANDLSYKIDNLKTEKLKYKYFVYKVFYNNIEVPEKNTFFIMYNKETKMKDIIQLYEWGMTYNKLEVFEYRLKTYPYHNSIDFYYNFITNEQPKEYLEESIKPKVFDEEPKIDEPDMEVIKFQLEQKEIKKEEDPDINAFIAVEKDPQPVNLGDIKKLIGYPSSAYEMGISGKVTIRVLVSEEGKYIKHQIIRSPHKSLTDACEIHIKNLQFTPGIQMGKPIKCWANVPFDFKLH
jgi:TonB family protein